jgi:hypothetical protein
VSAYDDYIARRHDAEQTAQPGERDAPPGFEWAIDPADPYGVGVGKSDPDPTREYVLKLRRIAVEPTHAQGSLYTPPREPVGHWNVYEQRFDPYHGEDYCDICESCHALGTPHRSWGV